MQRSKEGAFKSLQVEAGSWHLVEGSAPGLGFALHGRLLKPPASLEQRCAMWWWKGASVVEASGEPESG